MNLSEAIDRFNNWRSFQIKFKTVKGYDMVLRQFCLFVKNKDLEDIKFSEIMDWFNLMRYLGWDQNSFIPKAMALKKFFEYYQHQGIEVINPLLIPIPEKEYKSPRVLTDDNYQKILAIMPENSKDPRCLRNRLMINMLWDTGMRAGEILSLNVGDCDLIEKRAVIRTEKAKQFRPVRQIFWSDPTNDQLIKWLEKREWLLKRRNLNDDGALFISINNQKLGLAMTNSGLGEMLRRASERAGIAVVNAHSFRHRKGHHIVEMGGSNSDVANILGHSSLQSTYVYTMMSGRELQERQRKFL